MDKHNQIFSMMLESSQRLLNMTKDIQKEKDRSIAKVFVLFMLLTLCLPAMGQSIRPSHWTMEYVRFMQERGALWCLSPTEMPYSVDEVKFRISDCGLRNDNKVGAFAQRIEKFLEMLPRENEEVLVWLQSANSYHALEEKEVYWGRQRGIIGIRLRPWLEVYNTIVLDNRLDENTQYLGERQSGYASYTEQAYALAHVIGFEVKFGRDFIRWGAGRDATLLISDYSRPLDQVAASYSSRWFKYSFFTASLDLTSYTDFGFRMVDFGFEKGAIDSEQQAATSMQYRYISGHRLEVRPWKYLYVGISEAILYGGPNFSYDFAYLNPFIFYHGEQMNGPNGGNTMGSLSIAIMPRLGYYLYGDLLIDDVQIEKSGPGDLEPNEIGYLTGANIADLGGIFGLDIYAEYTRIANRTYNGQGGQWEKWLHRNEPIGHFLGNDFDRVIAGMSYWPRPEYKIDLGFEKRHRGEGRIDKPFDTPWMSVPIGQEYHEAFPSGIVEKSSIWRFDLSWQPRWWLRIGGTGQYRDIVNRENVKGKSAKFWEWNLSMEMDWVGKWKVWREGKQTRS